MPDLNRITASTTVLLIDNNALLRAAMALALQREGFAMHRAASVAEGLAVLAKYPRISVVVLEVDLGPGTPRGFAFADVALARHPDLGVIFLTGRTDLLMDRLQGPHEVHLTKPCAMPRLAEAIRRVASVL